MNIVIFPCRLHIFETNRTMFSFCDGECYSLAQNRDTTIRCDNTALQLCGNHLPLAPVGIMHCLSLLSVRKRK